jgi:hypothetical protein
MIKKCNKPGCDIMYETTWQENKRPKSDNTIIKDYMYRIIMKEKIKNEGKFGVGKVIIQFLQQEVDKLS